MLKRLGVVNPDLKSFYIATLCNGEICGIETRGKKVIEGACYYVNGVEITKREDGNYIFDTWTIEGGYHTLNSRAIVTPEGILIEREKSMVNIFALGTMKADQGFINEYIEELGAKKIAWIETE